MLNIIGFIISFVALIFFIFSVRFMNKEGKDERGYKILGEAGMSALVAFLFSYSVVFLINSLYPLKGAQYTFALTCILGFVLLTYSGVIMILKRKY